MEWRDQHVHLMGVGGAGMSALVPLLLQAGARCSGCDLVRSPMVEQCERSGVKTYLGHDLSHLQDVDVIVYSSAVPLEHEELREARLRGMQVMSRASCLAELMRGHKTIAVAGSHGKTTTTWMLGHLLNEADLDPLIMCGGSLNALNGVGGQAGAGSLFVAEVDESDGGFLHVDPSIAILCNLEAEHIRHYGDFAALCTAVHNWLGSIPADGYVITTRDEICQRLCTDIQAKVISCGIETGDYSCRDLQLGPEGSDCTVMYLGVELGHLHVPMPGVHNVLNALFAIAAARCVAPDIAISTMNNCERVDRRFSVRAQHNGIRVVEDYAHHPTEIAATIAAAALGAKQVHVIFQPHRYSRTADSFQEFVHCFDHAASVVILPIYAAHEEAMPGIHARGLAEAVAAHHRQAFGHGEQVQYAAHNEEAIGFMQAQAQSGDSVLVLGAGDVNQLVEPLCEALQC